MADEPSDQKLRHMAEHRGLKLLKSRKRKPGSGDYGKFGLTDADGKVLLGVSKEGLTAAPGDIEAYLRKGATSNWKASAETAPARPPHSPKGRQADEEQDDERVIRPRPRRRAADPVGSPQEVETSAIPRGAMSPAALASDEREKVGERERSKSIPRKEESAPLKNQSGAALADVALKIRTARPSDAAKLQALLRQLTAFKTDELGIARNLEKVRKANGGTCVAEMRNIVGCCCWTSIQTLQHGMIGRISLLLVDQSHRRQGVATAMLDDACAALRKAGCSRIEVMSDIEISNAHNFFRTLKFEQTSYRFARDISLKD